MNQAEKRPFFGRSTSTRKIASIQVRALIWKLSSENKGQEYHMTDVFQTPSETRDSHLFHCPKLLVIKQKKYSPHMDLPIVQPQAAGVLGLVAERLAITFPLSPKVASKAQLC